MRRSSTWFFCLLALGNAFGQGAISPSHPELLQSQIVSAYTSGQSSVVIPPGVYQIPALGNGFHLDLENMTNFEIDATGATFVFQDVTAGGVFLNNCDRVTFHGATLYYATPPFSQGVIQAIAADGSSFDVQIEAGYPTNLDDPRYFTAQIAGHLFDSTTRWWKRNVYGDVAGTSTLRLGLNTFRVFTSFLGGAAVGDLIGFRSGTGYHIIVVDGSSRSTLTNLTILNSPLFGIAEVQGGALGPNHYTYITVKRGNRPAGAITDPLFSTTADGIHSAEARQGPDIENCNLESMPDDGIAVHGHYSWVMEPATGNTLVVSNTSVLGGANFLVGDPLRLLDPNGVLVAEAVVTGVTPLPGYQSHQHNSRQTLKDFSVGPYYQIALDRAVTADFDYFASNPNASGAGFTLLNNTIRNNRARGMDLKADNGLVEGNLIDGSTMAGIRVGPEFYWAESCYPRNLTIRNNTIRNVGYWAGQTAALLIAPDEGLPATAGYRNLTIDGNVFEDFDITAIFLSSASGVTISNNTFTNLQNSPVLAINNLGANVIPGTLIFIVNSTGVQFQGNSTSQLGALFTTFVEAGAGASVTGTAYTSPLADSTADFSGTQGLNNWYYGYFPSGDVNAFTLLPTFVAQGSAWEHTTYGPPWTLLAGNSYAHPNGTDSGIEEWATRRWISPVSGIARIAGHLAKVDTNPVSTGVFGRIYVNHTLVYQHFVAGTDGTGVDYSVLVALNAGDPVDFALSPNGVAYDDFSYFYASISTIASGRTTSACDVNQDGTTDMADARGIVKEALGGNPAVDDLNGGRMVNVVDVQTVINAAMGRSCIAL